MTPRTDANRLSDVPIPADTAGREVLELTLLDALRIGRSQNLDIKAEELLPFQFEEGLRIERAFFEPELFGDVSIGRSEDPLRNAFQPEIQRETFRGSLGLRQRVATGGLFELTFLPARLRQTTTSTLGSFPAQLSTSDVQASVTQPLLRGAWTDYGLASVETARTEWHAARHRFERRVQDTLLQIVEAYWELVYSREDYRVVSVALDLAREQLRITNERIRVRELAERDRVSDEADVARRAEERIRAENVIRQREDQLRRLLFDDSDGTLWDRNLRPVSPIESSFEPPDDDWREAARVALEHRPDIAALRVDVRTAEIASDRARRDVLPRLDLVGSYASDGAASAFPDAWADSIGLAFPDWSLALQFSIPIGNNAARANRDRALLELERTQRLLYAAELDVAREVRDALRELRTLAEAIRAARESVRLAETVLDTEREKQRVGRATLFEVQQRNQELLDARQRLLRNQLDFRSAEARLLHVKGALRADGELSGAAR